MIFITGRQAKSHLSPLCLDYIWLVPGWLVDKSSVKKRCILQWSATRGFHSEDKNVTNPAVSHSKWLWWINHLWNCKADNLEFNLASSVSILCLVRNCNLFTVNVQSSNSHLSEHIVTRGCLKYLDTCVTVFLQFTYVCCNMHFYLYYMQADTTTVWWTLRKQKHPARIYSDSGKGHCIWRCVGPSTGIEPNTGDVSKQL